MAQEMIEILEPRRMLAATLQPGGNAGQFPEQFSLAGGKLFFESFGGEGQNVFVASADGANVTQLPMKDVNTVVSAGKIVYFTTTEIQNDKSVYHLWSSDGTLAGTHQLVELPVQITKMFAFKDGVVFPMLDEPGFGSDQELYFARAGELRRVKDINPGSGSGVPGFDVYPPPSDYLIYRDQLFFPADDGVHGQELWRTDGTEAGTVMVKDLVPTPKGALFDSGGEPGNLIRFGSSFLFTARDNFGNLKLWISNGTSAGTRVLYDFQGALSENYEVYNLCVAGNLLYFQVHDTRYNAPAEFTLWRSDGTTAGTYSISQLDDAADLPVAFNGSLYFWRQQYSDFSDKPSVLWKSDGTAAGTAPVKSFDDALGRDRVMTATDGSLYFNAEVADNDVHLWQSDGTLMGTVPVIGGSVGTIRGMITAGNRLYLSTEAALDWQIFTVNDSPVSTTTSTGTITGVVFNDIDHDGIRDEAEPALGGYRVFLDADGDGICDATEASVKSSSSGRYTFSSLPAGKYIVAQVTSPARGPTTPTAYSIKLKSGQRVTRSFGNAGGILSGVVFLDINRDGYRNANEVTIPRAHVFLDLDNDGTWEANEPIVRTSSSGRYTFSDIAAGTWRIRLLPIPNMFFTAGDMRKVTLPVGARLTRNFGVLGG